MRDNGFQYKVKRFADIQILRYKLTGFDELTLRQKQYIYCLSQATLAGRDILFEQNGKYNLRIRKLLEYIYINFKGNRTTSDFLAFEEYLRRVWFSNGIYHHYSNDKILPSFSADYLKELLEDMERNGDFSACGTILSLIMDELFPVMFNPDVMPKKVNKNEGDDLVLSSACNFYEGVTQKEVEDFYADKKKLFADECELKPYLSDFSINLASNGLSISEENKSLMLDSNAQPSWGLNSKVVKREDKTEEQIYKINGMYDAAIREIVIWLTKAKDFVENEQQVEIIDRLIKFYTTGDLVDFDKYSILWTLAKEGDVDFINGFIEVYGDPLGMKATWEGIVEYIDKEATKRTRAISDNAQWFEDNSPIDDCFKKESVEGISANVICAAMLGGDEYPSSAIGINLPNANWIRSTFGSKSVSIGNLTEAYNEVSKGSGFFEEFVNDKETIELIEKYDNICDKLHTDLHECLGHGSGKMMQGVGDDALKSYGSTIEEARADLFGLYYMADEKLLELGLLDDKNAYKAHYFTYMLNGLMTQLIRIQPGRQIEEDHMRNRALIAYWAYQHSEGTVRLVKEEGKTYLEIHDYDKLRSLFAVLLKEIQRIKSEGDYDAAKKMVETYGVKVDGILHKEVLERYKKLNLAPYKGFVNPRLCLKHDDMGNVLDVVVDYSEGYDEQMLRYSTEYSFL